MSYFEEPQQTAKSKGCSIFLWVFGILGLLIVLACAGVIGGSFWFFRKSMSQDPAKIRQATEEITEIELPERFQPMMLMNAFGTKFVMYQLGDTPESGGMLMLMEAGTGPGQNAEQMKKNFNQGFQGQGTTLKNVDPDKTQEQTYTIRGEEVTVVIEHGTGDDGKAMVQATAQFTSKQGKPAMLIFMVNENDWDEAEFDALLNSMK
jgi:predicted secreted protein